MGIFLAVGEGFMVRPIGCVCDLSLKKVCFIVISVLVIYCLFSGQFTWKVYLIKRYLHLGSKNIGKSQENTMQLPKRLTYDLSLLLFKNLDYYTL